jgi:MFS family permease
MATREDVTIPLVDTPRAPRVPLHLRYFALLKRNGNFRWLWMAQLVSEIGDWFYSLAIYDLLLGLTGSGKSVSYAIILQTLPWFFMTPLSGTLVDRLPRRRLMILADVVRGCVVLGLILVRTRSDVWMVYALLGAEVVFASIFEPARSALLPDLVEVDELLPANALSSATWSVALAVGASLGGVVTALLGRNAAFTVNSLSFFASGLLISRIRCRESHLSLDAHGTEEDKSLREGLSYLSRTPQVVMLVLAKGGLGMIAGALLLLTLLGERVFPVAGRGALAVGLLYAARGAGAGLGPLLADRLTRGEPRRMWKAVGLAFFWIGGSYLSLSRAPVLAAAMIAVCCAHLGGSVVWVTSTTLLQLTADDRFRGRIFSLDYGLNMLAAAACNYAIGVGADTWHLKPRQLAALMGTALLVPGLLWFPALARWVKDRAPAPAVSAQGEG